MVTGKNAPEGRDRPAKILVGGESRSEAKIFVGSKGALLAFSWKRSINSGAKETPSL